MSEPSYEVRLIAATLAAGILARPSTEGPAPAVFGQQPVAKRAVSIYNDVLAELSKPAQ